MADLRSWAEELGYTDVSTVLQSGNLLFTGDDPEPVAAQRIAEMVSERCGFDAQVVCRSAERLRAAVRASPLADIATDDKKYLLGMLFGTPEADRSSALTAEYEHLRFDGDHLYLWCPDGVLASPFGTVDWRRRLGVDCTMRNWATLAKVPAGLGD